MPNKDPEKAKAYRRKWYLANQQTESAKAAARNRARRKIVLAYIVEYKSTHPCVDCGEADFIVLDFDHVRGEKVSNLCEMGRYSTLEQVKEEIAKCEIRCSNCHRRATYKRRHEMATGFDS